MQKKRSETRFVAVARYEERRTGTCYAVHQEVATYGSRFDEFDAGRPSENREDHARELLVVALVERPSWRPRRATAAPVMPLI